jgi:hypothetical protein
MIRLRAGKIIHLFMKEVGKEKKIFPLLRLRGGKGVL